MTKIDWTVIQKFEAKEFPGNTNLASSELFLSLDKARALVGERMYPSPVDGALARYGGSKSSQHYVGEDYRHVIRKATAVDVFIEGKPIENYHKLLSSGLFKGIGIYLDTNGPDGKPWVMFHLDLRPVSFTWFRDKAYIYPRHGEDYWQMFRSLDLYKDRKFQR